MFPRIPYRRAVALVRIDGDRLALRMRGDDGVLMTAPLRPMTLHDAFGGPRRFRRPR